MLTSLIDFLVDYFTHLNARKIIGGVLAIIGLRITIGLPLLNSSNRAVLYGLGGITLGSIGVIIILYDMAKDKSSQDFSDLETLSKAYKDNKTNRDQDPTQPHS